ncbi:hypothetical protein EW146_g888 [Bondarzewia mesenterica]|uniref:DUF2828 domain-containing protein n=1 Tax=Bondarzewia mesenterica TaxID=1095465 RepID=A0A4S4M5G7_9AGAM|nr:hypothetical protein EW146_g888 [Bondarzewia mesenterica]
MPKRGARSVYAIVEHLLRNSSQRASPHCAHAAVTHQHNANSLVVGPELHCALLSNSTYRSSKVKRALSLNLPKFQLRMISTPPAAASSQDVTLPFISELYDPNFLDVLLPPRDCTAVVDVPVQDEPRNPLIDALKATSHRTYTENDSPAFNSTLSPTLDAFQELTRYASKDVVHEALSKAWAEDPDLTLRIIWNARSIHDGKSEKELFYTAFGWLFKHHPRTAVTNLSQLVRPVCSSPKTRHGMSHGYWKDLLNILALATLDQFETIQNRDPELFLHCQRPYGTSQWMKRLYATEFGKLGEGATAEDRKAAADAATRIHMQLTKEAHARRARQNHDILVQKLAEPRYRALFIAIARLFAEQLSREVSIMKRLNSLPDGEERLDLLHQITLASKWAPSPGRAHDRVTNISTAISLLLHHHGTMSSLTLPFDSAMPLPTLETHILRSFYQRWILAPLRATTLIPEPLMSANHWTSIRYARVPSICMKTNSEHFFRHDPAGFEKYLENVVNGKQKISGATLMPHQLLHSALQISRLSKPSTGPPSTAREMRRSIEQRFLENKKKVVETQWPVMIARLRESGALDNAMAVCDVSGSMGCLSSPEVDSPIFPAIALSMVLSQLAKPPFANGFITFSSHPKFVQLDPALGLARNAEKMHGSEWEMNTNLHAVFVDLFLPLAKQHRVPKEDMIKRLFIFSDMQFDEARRPFQTYTWNSEDDQVDPPGDQSNPADWATNHDEIVKAYTEVGYDVPQIVYWNLDRQFRTTPVEAQREGVALMNGFSPAMLKVFMGEDESTLQEKEVREEFNPLAVMKKAIGKASYNGLVVVD